MMLPAIRDVPHCHQDRQLPLFFGQFGVVAAVFPECREGAQPARRVRDGAHHVGYKTPAGGDLVEGFLQFGVFRLVFEMIGDRYVLPY
jgi:hypothetical protein